MVKDINKEGMFNNLNCDYEEDFEYVKKFTADFETSTWKEDETWVWAWAVCEIENIENIKIGNNIESFIEFCKKQKNSIFYFHNLKFDGEFIIYYLLKNGFKHVENKKDVEDMTFTTLISDMGQFYNITVYFKKGNKDYVKASFIDSLKIIPFSVEEIAKSFNLPISKLELDYKKEREIGHIITKEEEEYIQNDVKIVAMALEQFFKEDLTKMTIASNSLNSYKKLVGKSRFEHCFPVLDKETDEFIRNSYRGGFTYLNPIYVEKDVKNIVNLDVNSLYPYVMYSKELPFGEPKYFKGEYKEDKIYNLYVQRFYCSFEIKKNKIPTVQIKGSMSFIPNEYLESSNHELVEFTMTSVDLKMFKEHYNIYNLTYLDGYKFKTMNGIFTEYIDFWIKRKNEATISGNKAQRAIAKLMLNSLYGKFATSLEVQSKIPYLGEDDIIHYKFSEKEEKDGLYIPIASFITAYAREKTIKTSQKIKEYSIDKYNKDMYIYSDTDSIKTLLPIDELKQFCDIDDVKLGYWKNEGIASKGKWIRQKCYLEEIDGKMHITCSGLPKNCYSKVEWKKFKVGFTCSGKLTFKHIKGGVKLVDTDFTIKDLKVTKNLKKF